MQRLGSQNRKIIKFSKDFQPRTTLNSSWGITEVGGVMSRGVFGWVGGGRGACEFWCSK